MLGTADTAIACTHLRKGRLILLQHKRSTEYKVVHVAHVMVLR
jgi:hypothetical protein